MANLREIRGRIAGVRSTSKITQAMKLVAAAKLRRAQDGILAARPYARKLRSLIGHLLTKVDHDILPLLQDREEVRNVLILVVTADRGMCGAFNSNIIKRTNQLIDEVRAGAHSPSVHLLCIGRRGVQFFQKTSHHLVDRHTGVVGVAPFSTIQTMMTGILTQYLSGTYDKVLVVYNEFKSVIQQIVTVDQILPLSVETLIAGQQGGDEHFVDYIYEPSETELLEHLIPRHLHFHLWRVLLESNASEQGARMTAMDNATTNALDLIDALQLEYNSLRQEKITKELLEIVSGAEALKKSA